MKYAQRAASIWDYQRTTHLASEAEEAWEPVLNQVIRIMNSSMQRKGVAGRLS